MRFRTCLSHRQPSVLTCCSSVSCPAVPKVRPDWMVCQRLDADPDPADTRCFRRVSRAGTLSAAAALAVPFLNLQLHLRSEQSGNVLWLRTGFRKPKGEDLRRHRQRWQTDRGRFHLDAATLERLPEPPHDAEAGPAAGGAPTPAPRRTVCLAVAATEPGRIISYRQHQRATLQAEAQRLYQAGRWA